ncbi:unnamed protein product [Adineta steineri]|uniref:G-protein coupled receptors family 1 profile domain-containing protein n=1 Tax=Adineta steineri TaxID=433720 RepID=A0A813XHI6_9BILA|nr:unnamed protein product [Adineta steineri]
MASSLAITTGLYGYGLSYTLGFIGHTCSLITFSSKNLRQTSTGLLFIFLTFANILYQLITIRDFITLYLLIPTIPSVELCRFCTFIRNFSTFTSAWLLVFIAIDRFIRARFPLKQTRLCTCKTGFYSFIIVCICSTLFTCHVLQSEFIYTDVKSNTCGPSRSPITIYSNFYFNIWPILQVIITYFIPSCLMIISVVSIYSKVRSQRNIVRRGKNEKIQQHMLILMISSVTCFAVCTLSYSIHRVVYSRTGVTSATVDQIAVLTVFYNLNFCLTFYIHCLASKLFRQTFIKQIYMCIRNQNRQQINNHIHPLVTITRPAARRTTWQI